MGFFARILSFVFWVGVLVAVFSPEDTARVIGRLIQIIGTVLVAIVGGGIGILDGGAAPVAPEGQ